MNGVHSFRVVAGLAIFAGMAELLALVAGPQIAADAPTEAETKDMKSLQGIWMVVNENSFRKGEKWIIAGGRIREGKGDELYRFYKLEPQKMPKGIEITVMASEDGQPLVIYNGIYLLDGDQLKVYLVGPGEARPNAFPQETGLTPVLILKREKS